MFKQSIPQPGAEITAQLGISRSQMPEEDLIRRSAPIANSPEADDLSGELE
jgi:hypothetical protein